MTKKHKTELRGKFSQDLTQKTNRSKTTAALLAIFFGGLGLHKFYLGQAVWGLIYLVFSWTFIPLILGIIEGLIFLGMSDHSFKDKYS
jgi:TM2 domain-containing membrane protein YozV